MIRFIRYLIILIVAIVVLLFIFANRQLVTVSFDPFAATDEPAFALEAPLFAVAIVAAMLGVVAGATTTWVSQGRYRRAARVNRSEAAKWRAEAQRTVRSSAPSLPRS